MKKEVKPLPMGKEAVKKTATWIKQNKKPFISIFLLSLVLLYSTILKFYLIKGAMPYPGHVDEQYISDPAIRILKTGDFNPHRFTYPTLPLYITTAAMSMGYVLAASHLELINTAEIGSSCFPYYTHSKVVLPAKFLLAILSVIAALFMGIMAFQIFENYYLLFFVPLVISLSDIYFLYSHKYLNVDIVGTFFIVTLYFYLFYFFKKDTNLTKAVIPGFLCGLVIACKYSLFFIVIPPILTVLFFSKKQRIYRISLIFCFMLLGFFLAVPYSLLDFSTFLNDIGNMGYHYKSGHQGFEGIPGIPQLVYYLKVLIGDFGYWTVLFAAVGLITAAVKTWKKTLVLLSFPLSLLIYMSLQKVHFIRNILALYGFYALFAAIGILGLYELLRQILQRSRISIFLNKPKNRYLTSLILVAILFVICFPVLRPIQWAGIKPDSRNLAVKWIKKNIGTGSILIVPDELCLYTGHLEKDYKVVKTEFGKLEWDKFFQDLKPSGQVHVLMPQFSFERRRPQGEKLADRLNELHKKIEVIKLFPGKVVLINSSIPVPGGNPTFSIGRLKYQERVR